MAFSGLLAPTNNSKACGTDVLVPVSPASYLNGPRAMGMCLPAVCCSAESLYVTTPRMRPAWSAIQREAKTRGAVQIPRPRRSHSLPGLPHSHTHEGRSEGSGGLGGVAGGGVSLTLQGSLA